MHHPLWSLFPLNHNGSGSITNQLMYIRWSKKNYSSEESLEHQSVSQSVIKYVYSLSLEIRIALQIEEFYFVSNSINWYEARIPWYRRIRQHSSHWHIPSLRVFAWPGRPVYRNDSRQLQGLCIRKGKTRESVSSYIVGCKSYVDRCGWMNHLVVGQWTTKNHTSKNPTPLSIHHEEYSFQHSPSLSGTNFSGSVESVGHMAGVQSDWTEL